MVVLKPVQRQVLLKKNVRGKIAISDNICFVYLYYCYHTVITLMGLFYTPNLILHIPVLVNLYFMYIAILYTKNTM